MHLAHPLGVAAGQVVVDRDDVHALAGQRVEVGRQHAGEGLALTGLHLGDVAEVQRRAAHDLHVDSGAGRAPGGRPPARWRTPRAAGRRGSPRRRALLVLVGQLAQLGVGEVGVVLLDRVDGVGDRLQSAELSTLAGTEDLLKIDTGLSTPSTVCRTHGRRNDNRSAPHLVGPATPQRTGPTVTWLRTGGRLRQTDHAVVVAPAPIDHAGPAGFPCPGTGRNRGPPAPSGTARPPPSSDHPGAPSPARCATRSSSAARSVRDGCPLVGH